MKKRMQLLGVIIGIILISIFPVLAVVSFFMDIEYEKEEKELILFENSENEILKLERNKSANIINIDEILAFEEEIIDEKIPLGIEEKAVYLSGKDVKNNFISHKDKIEKNKVIFEIVTQNGENLFFKSFEELEFYINDDDKYQKHYLLDDNSNLKRYTFLEISKVKN